MCVFLHTLFYFCNFIFSSKKANKQAIKAQNHNIDSMGFIQWPHWFTWIQKLFLKIFFSPLGQNACVDQPCSLLCLPQPGNKHHCVCPDGVSTTILPSGEHQCQCPSGYQLHNNTCVKTGLTDSEVSDIKSSKC